MSFVFAGDAEFGESIEGESTIFTFKVSFKTTKDSSGSVKAYGYGSTGEESSCYSHGGVVIGKSESGEYGVNSLSPYVKQENEMESLTPLVSSPSVCEGELSSSRKHPPVSSLHYMSPPLMYCRAIEVMIRVGSSGIHSEGELIRCCEEYLKKENGRVSEVGE